MSDGNRMTKTFDALPIGLCVGCLEAMIDPERGHRAFFKDLGRGRGLWGMYCEHNNSGAYSFAGDGLATRWTVNTPVEIDEFLKLMAMASEYYIEASPPRLAS